MSIVALAVVGFCIGYFSPAQKDKVADPVKMGQARNEIKAVQ